MPSHLFYRLVPILLMSAHDFLPRGKRFIPDKATARSTHPAAYLNQVAFS
jgi:hypothetical protein